MRAFSEAVLCGYVGGMTALVTFLVLAWVMQ